MVFAKKSVFYCLNRRNTSNPKFEQIAFQLVIFENRKMKILFNLLRNTTNLSEQDEYQIEENFHYLPLRADDVLSNHLDSSKNIVFLSKGSVLNLIDNISIEAGSFIALNSNEVGHYQALGNCEIWYINKWHAASLQSNSAWKNFLLQRKENNRKVA